MASINPWMATMGMWDHVRCDSSSPASDLYSQFIQAQAMRNVQMSEGAMWPPANQPRSTFGGSTWERYSNILSSNSVPVAELQKIREEGNRFFAEEKWRAAVNAYSLCIDLAVLELDRGGPPKSLENVRKVLMLAYSNRAESWLRMNHYEDALSDAEKTLEIDPKHVKTLFRKGKAAHGLGLFEKSCKAFEVALEESPHEHSIKEHLKASTTALKQSTTGEYELADYLLAGSDSKPPSCADFVGPLEIRRVGYGEGRRGLFATRDVKAGELLLVGNPLAAVQETAPTAEDLLGASKEFAMLRAPQDLLRKVIERLQTSKRHRAQFSSLCSPGDGEKEIPPMELFRPGSEWVPEESLQYDIDIDQISKTMAQNVQGTTVRVATSDGNIFATITFFGIWGLPSFANHSCSPNAIVSFIGNACFFRASADIVKGEELTMSYLAGDLLLDGLFQGVQGRRAELKAKLITCNCARCVFEGNLEQKLAKVYNGFCDVLQRQSPGHLGIGAMGCPAKYLVKFVDRVEALVHESRLGPKEQGWIRALFLVDYIAKYCEALKLKDGVQSSDGDLILDSMTSVCVDHLALKQGTTLLQAVEQRYSKQSRLYKHTLDRVMCIFRLFYGNEPKNVLLKLIKDKSLETRIPLWNVS